MELQVTGCHCPTSLLLLLHDLRHPHLTSPPPPPYSPVQRKDALLSELKAAELAASDPLRQADSLRASAAAVEAEGRNQRVALLATESNRALQAKLRRQEETVEQYQKMLTEARAALRREKASSAAESKRLSEQLYEQHEEGIQKLQKASASRAQPTLTRSPPLTTLTTHHLPPLTTTPHSRPSPSSTRCPSRSRRAPSSPPPRWRSCYSRRTSGSTSSCASSPTRSRRSRRRASTSRSARRTSRRSRRSSTSPASASRRTRCTSR